MAANNNASGTLIAIAALVLFYYLFIKNEFNAASTPSFVGSPTPAGLFGFGVAAIPNIGGPSGQLFDFNPSSVGPTFGSADAATFGVPGGSGAPHDPSNPFGVGSSDIYTLTYGAQ